MKNFFFLTTGLLFGITANKEGDSTNSSLKDVSVQTDIELPKKHGRFSRHRFHRRGFRRRPIKLIILHLLRSLADILPQIEPDAEQKKKIDTFLVTIDNEKELETKSYDDVASLINNDFVAYYIYLDKNCRIEVIEKLHQQIIEKSPRTKNFRRYHNRWHHE